MEAMAACLCLHSPVVMDSRIVATIDPFSGSINCCTDFPDIDSVRDMARKSIAPKIPHVKEIDGVLPSCILL